jgi:hypothetical protein
MVKSSVRFWINHFAFGVAQVRMESFSHFLSFGKEWESSLSWVIPWGRTGISPHFFYTMLDLGDIYVHVKVYFLIEDLHVTLHKNQKKIRFCKKKMFTMVVFQWDNWIFTAPWPKFPVVSKFLLLSIYYFQNI